MAGDLKISGLTNDPTPTGDDLLVSVNDPAGTPVNKNVKVSDLQHYLMPSGLIQPYAARTAPSGWKNCDGSSISRTTFADLFTAIVPTLNTVTITNATPAVVTNTAHGLSTGDSIFLTTNGGLPTGLSVNTLYYVVRVDANSYNLSTTRANAYAGTKIATSSAGSGVHTAWDCPYGLGDGSTTFTLPDFRGRVVAGMDTTGGSAAGLLTLAQTQGVYGNQGASGGEQGHVITTAELAAHTHPETNATAVGGGVTGIVGAGNTNTDGATSQITGVAGSNTAHNNVQPIQLSNYIIKT